MPLELTELTDLMKTVDFKVFRARPSCRTAASPRCAFRAAATLTRKEIDDYTPFVKIYGAGGLAYIKVNDAAKPNEEGPAVADRQVPAGAGAARRSSSAPARRPAT